MRRQVQAATLTALRAAQAGGLEQAKALARVVRQLDMDTSGMAARELRELLLRDHGVDLREERINRSRYVARLLYALDPEHGDPPELASVDDAETLYQMQRLHEVQGTPLHELLSALQRHQAQGRTPKEIRQRMKDAVATVQGRATSGQRETWRQPLMRVPGEVCDGLNQAFGAWARGHDLTQQEAVAALAELLTGPVGQMSDIGVPDDVQARFGAALLGHGKRMGLPPAQALTSLCTLLEEMDARHWRTLYGAVGAMAREVAPSS